MLQSDEARFVEAALGPSSSVWAGNALDQLASLQVPENILGHHRFVLRGDINEQWANWFVESIGDPKRYALERTLWPGVFSDVFKSIQSRFPNTAKDEQKKLASVVADVLLARAEGFRESRRREALSLAQRGQLLELAGTTPRCWLCGAEFSEVAVENFRFRRRSKLAVPLYVDVLKPRGLLPRDLRIEADHVIPFSKGGGDGDNLRLACGWCNNHKSSYTSIYDVEGQPKALRAKLNRVTALPQPLWIVRLLATVRRCEYPEGCDQSVDNARMTIAPMSQGGVMNPTNLRVTCYEHDPFADSRLRPHSEVVEIWGTPLKGVSSESP